MFLNENALQVLKNKDYRDSTITTMDYNVKRIFKDAGFGNKYLGIRLRDSSKIIDTIKTYPAKQQKQYIYAVMVLFQHSPFKRDSIYEQYKTFYESVSERRENILTMQQPTQQVDKRKVISSMYDKYYDYVNKYNTDSTRVLAIKMLIIGLYTLLPPARPQVWLNSVFSEYYNENPEAYPDANIIDLDAKQITIKHGKTMKKDTSYTFTLNDDVVNLIDVVKDKTASVYLIPELKTNTPMQQKQFTQLFKHLTETTPTMLRNVFVSNVIDKYGLENSEQRQQFAKFLGHSINTQNNIYSKYSSRVHSS